MNIPDGLIINQPSDEGAAYGEQLARMTEVELAKLKEKYPGHQEPCGTCAFRRGTYPNQCLSTVGDAVKCVMEKTEFLCHEKPGTVCRGWLIASEGVALKPAIECPWDWSLSDESRAKVDALRGK